MEAMETAVMEMKYDTKKAPLGETWGREGREKERERVRVGEGEGEGEGEMPTF